MIYKLSILASLSMLFFANSFGQKSDELRLDTNIILSLQKLCPTDAKGDGYIVSKDRVMRRHDNKRVELIDTAGLFIYKRESAYVNYWSGAPRYTPKVTGYFSFGPCGELYLIDYFVLKKQFSKYPEFIRKLHQTADADLIKRTADGTTSLLNEFYRRYVK